jgi:hypothetical protein
MGANQQFPRGERVDWQRAEQRGARRRLGF